MISNQIKNEPALLKKQNEWPHTKTSTRKMLFLRCANIAPADPLANQSQTLLGIITDPISQDKLSGLSIPLSEEAVALLESTCLESNLNI